MAAGSHARRLSRAQCALARPVYLLLLTERDNSLPHAINILLVWSKKRHVQDREFSLIRTG